MHVWTRTGERSLRWFEQLGQDIRYATRMLRGSPGFAAIAIGAVGIAIGINAGFFTLIDTFMWRPLPVARPEQLVRLLTLDGRGLQNIRFSYPEVVALSANARSIEQVIGYFAQPVAIKPSATTLATASSVGLVTGDYFTALGGSASAGRVLSTADERTDGGPVAVISDAYWQRMFGGSRDAIGRSLIVNGAYVTVVGVAAPTFIGINPLVPDIWMTLPQAERIGATPGRLLDPTNRFITLHARLRSGYTPRQARAELSGFVAEPPAPKGTRAALERIVGVTVEPRASMIPPTSNTLLILTPALFVVGLVLVIACANLANLLLCRALVRRREIAVRLSLGASRGRLIQQLLTESLLIAVAGAILGFVLADWTVKIVSRSYLSFVPPTLGSLALTLALTLAPSWRVVAYTVVLACVSSMTFGLVPALQATSLNLSGMLKGDDTAVGGRLRRSKVRDWLIAAQVAGSVVLIAAAGILTRGVQRFASSNSGLNPEHVAFVEFGIAPADHLPATIASDRATLDARIARAPGVAVVARAAFPPFSSWRVTRIRSSEASNDARPHVLSHNIVTPNYFDVIGQRIVDGRAFTSADSASGTSVAIVTQAAARALWPGRRAVGNTFRSVDANGELSAPQQVVGVVADAHSVMLWDPDDEGYLYTPAVAADFASLDMPILARMDAGAVNASRTIADIAAQVDPNAPLTITPLSALHDQQIVPFRYGAGITGAIALLGLALAVVGLYGVVAFGVEQRRREIAVHMAVGARPADVLKFVMRGELRLVGIGLAIGLVLAIGESGLINSWTLPLPSLGVLGLAAIAVFLMLVGTVATLVPASAALRISPMQALRQD
ncbi:MAG TPA: ADOP family duplicated permease [Gemmatimonadaceae bacterium]|nr:ADOP family duplicated permease [Gemmatimonadaceae bacterium]